MLTVVAPFILRVSIYSIILNDIMTNVVAPINILLMNFNNYFFCCLRESTYKFLTNESISKRLLIQDLYIFSGMTLNCPFFA
jgi:hypothetical protein